MVTGTYAGVAGTDGVTADGVVVAAAAVEAPVVALGDSLETEEELL